MANPEQVAFPPGIDPKGHSLFLDFDGTLVDIADRPDSIVVSPDLPHLLDALRDALDDRLAILTGRTIAEMTEFLPDYDGTIIGHHGAQVRRDGIVQDRTTLSEGLAALSRQAQEFCAEDEGLLYETKPFGFAIHYRAAPQAEEAVADFLSRGTFGIDDVVIEPAKMALEVKPKGIDKGEALTVFNEVIGHGGTVPLHVGDDISDEAAFRSAAALGGFGVRVGPPCTTAQYNLTSPLAVRCWLAEVML